MAKLIGLHRELLDALGNQEWWHMERGFSPPEFEVCLGAILTQNTNWRNVEKALENLKSAKLTNPSLISKASQKELEKAVRPSGFYKQKAERLKIFSDFVMGFGGFREFSRAVSREQLLKLKGIGPETADSILLYALNVPVFVIDAYTKRVFERLGILPDEKYSRKDGFRGNKTAKGKRKVGILTYDDWKHFFEFNLPKDTALYKEFHALIVELAKRHCKKDPECAACPLKKSCKF